MEINFRYKGKNVDTVIRGLVFRADKWLETEARIPLTAAEESLLHIETKLNGEFKALEEVFLNEVKAAEHFFGNAGKSILNAMKPKTVEEAVPTANPAPTPATPPAQEAVSTPEPEQPIVSEPEAAAEASTDETEE